MVLADRKQYSVAKSSLLKLNLNSVCCYVEFLLHQTMVMELTVTLHVSYLCLRLSCPRGFEDRMDQTFKFTNRAFRHGGFPIALLVSMPLAHLRMRT
jgi:hypothetical protein